MKNKKTILILVAGSVILGLFLFLLLRNNDKEVLSEPVIQGSIPSSKQTVKISLGGVPLQKTKYEVFSISPLLKLGKIKELAQSNGLEEKISDGNNYYLWERDGNIISYDAIANKVTISGMNILFLNQIDDNIFTNLAKKYFDEDWEYEVFSKTEKSDSTEYLAYRKLNTSAHIESRENRNQTDRVVVENGRITVAVLTVSSFSSTGEYVPLLDRKGLNSYINQSEYLKEIIPSYDMLNSVMEMDYLESYEDIAKTLSNCVAEEISVVYYYKNLKQGALTPVYKVSALCDVIYEKNTYQIPAVVYTNAIEPNYILLDEKE